MHLWFDYFAVFLLDPIKRNCSKDVLELYLKTYKQHQSFAKPATKVLNFSHHVLNKVDSVLGVLASSHLLNVCFDFEASSIWKQF